MSRVSNNYGKIEYRPLNKNVLYINTKAAGTWIGWDQIILKADLTEMIKFKPYNTVFDQIAIQNDNGQYIVHFYNSGNWICKITADK